MFKPFYLYRDPFTNAIIADGESKKALIEQKTAFNESTLKEVTINPDFIETMFDLQERPIEKLKFTKSNDSFFNSATPLSVASLKSKGVVSDYEHF
ncbi:hypothetical protein FC16_GL001483 [Loigolactobacillus coryniformis subsp. torquens DSM 20004 = KCTC 3535]|nr:hypothetical protein FC16_GL001483 [Loigolactobacillus coryniformis subsp. torquens DSM 20004 = KCTC 3535]